MGNCGQGPYKKENSVSRNGGASLSQQIRVGGGKKCPEHSSESGFLADRGKNRDRNLGGPSYKPRSVT